MFNPFDANFNKVSDGSKHTENIRHKVVEALSELSELKTSFSNHQYKLNENETGIVKLKTSNLELKNAIMDALILVEEYQTKKDILKSNICELQEQVEALDQETDSFVNNDLYDNVYQKFSLANQHSIATRLQDSKCKLMKYGFSPTHIEMVQQSCSVRNKRYK